MFRLTRKIFIFIFYFFLETSFELLKLFLDVFFLDLNDPVGVCRIFFVGGGMALKKGSRDSLVALHIVILLSSSLLTTTVSLSEPEADREILLRFKSTIIDTRNVLQNWSPTTIPCNGTLRWTGVICGDGGNVLKLVLQNMDLSGTLDVTPLAGLRDLKSISFMDNGFEGGMPDVGRFVWMRALYLSGNRLSGKIDHGEFDRMLALSRVHLSRNKFVGRIPDSLVGVARLTELMLDGNNFDGTIPEFRQLGLRVNFSNNDLEGPIPMALRTSNPTAFRGNKNLCGPPLWNPCESTTIVVSSSPTPDDNPGINLFQLIVILAVLSPLAVAGLFFLILQCRRRLTESSSSSDKDLLKHQPICIDGSCLIPGREVGNRKLVFVQPPPPTHGEVDVHLLRTFDIEDLLKSSAEVLGSGSFGSSYKSTMMNGSSVVVKRFREMNGMCREDFSDHMLRLGRLSHPNLIPLIAYFYRREEKLLISEHIPNGSLAHMLHGGGGGGEQATEKLNWPSRLQIMKGVGRGMAYLHKILGDLDLPHGHLKSSNVLLCANMEAHLSDYALGPLINTHHAHRTMVAFNAPEASDDEESVGKKADVWSLGIMILEIVTGRFPASSLSGGGGSRSVSMRGWVDGIVESWKDGEAVVDAEMGELSRYEKTEVKKLFEIGKDCCKVDVEKRLEMFEAISKIDDVMEVDLLEEYSSCVSEVIIGMER